MPTTSTLLVGSGRVPELSRTHRRAWFRGYTDRYQNKQRRVCRSCASLQRWLSVRANAPPLLQHIGRRTEPDRAQERGAAVRSLAVSCVATTVFAVGAHEKGCLVRVRIVMAVLVVVLGAGACSSGTDESQPASSEADSGATTQDAASETPGSDPEPVDTTADDDGTSRYDGGD